jgi:formylglycine-generating enzyme required for sulfatase activity
MAGGFKKQTQKILKILFVLILGSIFLWGCSSTAGKNKKQRQDSVSKQRFLKKKRMKRRRAPVESQIPSIREKEDDELFESRTPPIRWILPTRVNELDRSVMVFIPEGEYLSGAVTTKFNPTTAKRSHLAAYYIDRTEISVEQFRKYNPSYDETIFNNGKQCSNCPAMGIPWMMAQSYCRWAGKRLPTETEWEAAARGDSDFKWPWGSIPGVDMANLEGETDGFAGVAPVGSFPASPLGIWDMAGNVWEWIVAPYAPMPTPGSDGKLTAQIAKGGGWSSSKESAMISSRNALPPDIKNPAVGFRCVSPISP